MFVITENIMKGPV